MSWASKYVERQIKKRGANRLVGSEMCIRDRATPTKKDDQMVAEIKKVLKKF